MSWVGQDQEEKKLQQERKRFIGDRITALRMQKGISEAQLSRELERNKGYLQNITSGRAIPSMDMFFELCNYFEITPQQFFSVQPISLIRKEFQKLMERMTDEELEDWIKLLKHYVK
mgnify:CR=1 FL=1